jgi:hypothetical protein
MTELLEPRHQCEMAERLSREKASEKEELWNRKSEGHSPTWHEKRSTGEGLSKKQT